MYSLAVPQRIFMSIALIGAFLWLAFDGFHHWHEIRFSYAARFFPLEDILAGNFNPEQLGGEFDAASSGGFYITKLLHVAFIKFLFSIVPPHQGGFVLAIWIAMLVVGLSTGLGYYLFRGIFQDKWLAWLAWVCLVIAPIIPYLSGKLLSEVMALVFVTASILLFIQALNRPEHGWTWLAIASGGALLLAGLSRLDSILCCIGFVIASALTSTESVRTRHIWKAFGVTFTIFSLGYSAVLYFIQIEPYSIIKYFEHYSQIGMKSQIMSYLSILTFAGVVYLFVCSAFFSENGNARKNILLFVIWLVISCGPILAITWNYMVEPRYLLNGLLPVVGLGAIGLDVLLKRMKNLRSDLLVWGMGIVIITVVNYFIIHVMPYELDRQSILRAVDEVMEENSSAIILVPWTYTDFHFLRIMYPERAIKNVNQLVFEGEEEKMAKDVRAKLRLWYGNSYVESAVQVARMLEEHSVFYLGWTYYPPASYVKQLCDFLEFHSISAMIERLQLKNHLGESWLWNDADFNLELRRKVGQYKLYVVRSRAIVEES